MTPNRPREPDPRWAAHRSQHVIYILLQTDKHLKHFSFCSNYKRLLGYFCVPACTQWQNADRRNFFSSFFNLQLKPPRKMTHRRGRKEYTSQRKAWQPQTCFFLPGNTGRVSVWESVATPNPVDSIHPSPLWVNLSIHPTPPCEAASSGSQLLKV